MYKYNDRQYNNKKRKGTSYIRYFIKDYKHYSILGGYIKDQYGRVKEAYNDNKPNAIVVLI